MSGEERPPVRLDRRGFTEAAKSRLADFDPDPDLEAMVVVLLLMRTANEVMNLLEARVHRPAGWSWAGFRVLFSLLIAGSLAPNQLARIAGVSRASMSSALNTLERDGLVLRARSPEDGRRVTVSLTDSGRRQTEAAWQRHHKIEKRLLEGFDSRQRDDLTQLLDSLLAAAGENL